MKMKFEIGLDLHKSVKEIKLPENITKMINDYSSINLIIKRAEIGGSSTIYNFNVYVNGTIVVKEDKFKWGRDIFISLSGFKNVDCLKFSHEVKLSSLTIEFDGKKKISSEHLTGHLATPKFSSSKEGLTTLHVDKIFDGKLSFQDFGTEALHRLQRQFLNTPDTKDTVLTRMNIIQMIKDLKELGLK